MILPSHRTEPAHLPHQPLIDRQLIAVGRTIEFSGLAREILQDCAAFEEGERRAVRAVVIDDRWHAVVGRYFQKIGFELIAFADVHQMRALANAHLLKRNCDFPSVRCGPIVKIDHSACPVINWGQYSGYRFERKGQ